MPGYPEGHPGDPERCAHRFLRAKQAHADHVTTQMGFDPDAIATWIARMRHEGVMLPVHLGLPRGGDVGEAHDGGRQDRGRLLGRYLRKHRSLLGHVLKRSFGPDALLEALAPTPGRSPTADVRALHLFTFNQVEETVVWQQRLLEELS